jgi:co-chaperonin GroES (HSP10)
MKVVPKNDWLLVRFKKGPDTVGTGPIIRPSGSHIWQGEVLAAGPGKLSSKGKRIPLDVKVGDRVAFFRENLEHQQGRQVQSILFDMGEDICLIQEDAVLFVINPGATVSVDRCF